MFPSFVDYTLFWQKKSMATKEQLSLRGEVLEFVRESRARGKQTDVLELDEALHAIRLYCVLFAVRQCAMDQIADIPEGVEAPTARDLQMTLNVPVVVPLPLAKILKEGSSV